MSKNLKTQWRVQTKEYHWEKWKNRGLFETRASARADAADWRMHVARTRVVKYIKGQK